MPENKKDHCRGENCRFLTLFLFCLLSYLFAMQSKIIRGNTKDLKRKTCFLFSQETRSKNSSRVSWKYFIALRRNSKSCYHTGLGSNPGSATPCSVMSAKLLKLSDHQFLVFKNAGYNNNERDLLQ